jgi:TolA-binding protein
MTKTQWGFSAVLAVASVFVVMFWQLTPSQPQTTAADQTTAGKLLPTAPAPTSPASPSPIPASPARNEKPEARFAMAYQLLQQAQQGDAAAQYQLADILRFCDGISKNSSYFADDANYYLATANDTGRTFFAGLKQAITDCAEFNEQNLQDFNIEEPDIAAADYWLARAVMQQHPKALEQALAYFPQVLKNNDKALMVLDEQLAAAQPEALFQLGVCLTMQGNQQQAGSLLWLACQQGKDCNTGAIVPIQLPYLVHCSALLRTEEITADGNIFNAQRACYQKSSLLDISKSMLAGQKQQEITAQQQHLLQQLKSANKRKALLQQCVAP